MYYSVGEDIELIAEELPHAEVGTGFWLFEADAGDFAIFATPRRGS